MYASPRRVDFAEGYHVQLRAALNRGEGTLMTLSEGGAYVATPVNLLPQAQISVTIDIPELERSVEVEAIVAWENRGSRRKSAQPEGYGLRFIRVPSASVEAIRWLLKRDERTDVETDPARTRALSPREVQEAMRKAQELYGEAARKVHHPTNPLMETLNEWSAVAPETAALSTFETDRAVLETPARRMLVRPEPRPVEEGLDDIRIVWNEPEGSSERESRLDEHDSDDSLDGPPYRLEPSTLQAFVPPSSPGVFVLSYDGRLDARIGRADADLRRSLAEFVGDYGYFHFEVVSTRRDRFERECELFHRLGGDRRQLDNEEHPLPPPGPQLKCPVCVKRHSA